MNKLAVSMIAFALAIFVEPELCAAQTGTQPLNLRSLPASKSCPLEVSATRGFGHGGLLAADAARRNPIGQQLHLKISNSEFAAVKKIGITVHGFGEKAGMLHAGTIGSDSMRADKSLELRLNIASEGESATDLWLSGFTAIGMVDIDSITYADGSTWRSSEQQTCHIAPDGVTSLRATR